MNFYEETKVGDRYEIGSHLFTADSIKAFARRFDPQPFHMDEEAAKRSHFGALCASGWHTAAVWMRLTIDARQREAEALRARGGQVATIGPSPGFREMKWLRPVYAGDTIVYASEVTAMRLSSSRPDFGLVTMFSTGTNHRGERVMSFVNTAFVPRRPA